MSHKMQQYELDLMIQRMSACEKSYHQQSDHPRLGVAYDQHKKGARLYETADMCCWSGCRKQQPPAASHLLPTDQQYVETFVKRSPCTAQGNVRRVPCTAQRNGRQLRQPVMRADREANGPPEGCFAAKRKGFNQHMLAAINVDCLDCYRHSWHSQ